jgi:hypothetical protein
MQHPNTINVALLDEIIIGRVEPQIYAFTTETIPNYLKVGDTYRPIETRLNEWRKHFPNLEKKFENVAKVNNETFFRDFAVHYYLENELKRKRLDKNTFQNIAYYSNEFFENATENDLNEAIKDIKDKHQQNDSKYQYYQFDESRISITHTYKRTENFGPRPNQQQAITNFREALQKGRTNLLMYAVMRFGKSFTALCCAVEMEAKLVVVVSAKADVKGEWKKTVQSHLKFEGYYFLESEDLLRNETIIADKQKANEKIVLFLTLQDLQGDDIKSKHAAVFENQIDLLLIDETHFGARASEYGKVLSNQKEIKSEEKLNDPSIDDLEKIDKVLKAKIRIHLSGTPYRILMNSEFTDDDIIAFYQFTDIADDQEKWDQEHLNKDDVKEWDNPYYGFPQMIRFAFNPNESSIKKMEELKNNGVTFAFSELFKPQSITKDNATQLHQKFIHEQEILDLLKAIDGSETDNNVLSFLDYDKIKEGKMCRHLVFVLPYRASCDALEELIKNNNFKQLKEYKILNISGVENEKNFKDTQSVQNKIKECESENIKTITLTVNRMLTGSTVPEWDTMLYMKDTASPQEYDQAVFRLQNQYIKTLVDDQDDVIKYNMKPQTLLVDFNPNRMFVMQEEKAQIYNSNTETDGNLKLVERLKRELEVSPIIHLNKDKLVQVIPTDILNAVRAYSSNRSVLDEAKAIPLDLSLLDIDAIRAEIERQNEIESKDGLKVNAIQKPKEGTDLDIPTKTGNGGNNQEIEDIGGNGGNTTSGADKTEDERVNYLAIIKKKFASYYSRILFFAFCTEKQLMSLQEIIDWIETDAESKRIAHNLELDITILKLLRSSINHYALSKLEYKIQNINSLANDTAVSPIERASRAMKKFTRLSESEVVTPEKVTDMMVASLPEEAINRQTKILDIAAKQGEFVYAVYKKLGKEVANNMYAIPTSKLAYEFTRKVYQLLELNMENIEATYSSYELIKENNFIKKDTIKINNKTMKFDVILGNPPYQENDGGAKASAKPIYNLFVELTKELNPNIISIIMPTRWFAGGKGLDDFRDKMLRDIHISELHDFLNPDLLFKGTNNRGGICYFIRDISYDNVKKLTKVFTYKNDLTPIINNRNLITKDSDILIRHNSAVEMLKKIKSHSDFKSFEEHISSRKPFDLDGNIIKYSNMFRPNYNGLKKPITCYGKGKMIGFLESTEITKNTKWINNYKVFAPYANNIGTELNDDNLNAFVGSPKTICTETYIVIGAELGLNEVSANNLVKYLTSKFSRFMHSLSKVSQHGTSKTYKFVPLQNFTQKSDIDWSKSIPEIDKQLYAKYELSEEEIDFIESMIKPME